MRPISLVPFLAWLAFDSSSIQAQQGFVQCTRVLHRLTGEAAGDQFGWVSAPLPDLDGDGAPELVVGAPFHDAGGTNAGRIYVYSGRSGAELFHADGAASEERLGHSVRAIADVDGDGVADVLAGGRGTSLVPGAARLYSGATGALLRSAQIGAPGDGFGYAVDGFDDLDGDGIPELAVGAPFEGTAGAGAGRVYLVSGADGSTVLGSFLGENTGDNFGSAVARLGDVSGDGRPELIVGAPIAGAGGNGRAYVYDVAAGSLLYPALVPDATAAQFGQFFAADVGDVDGDGGRDFYVGDFADGASARGKAYVFSGTSGARLFTLTGQGGDGFGIGRGLGDVNGDGHADLLLGSWTSSAGATRAGKLEVFSGADRSVLRRITSTTVREALGFDAHGLDDVDGDGVAELVGTAASFGQGRGRVYVFAARPVETFGSGVPGTGAIVPTISYGGCPVLGAMTTIDLASVRGGAMGVLLVGRVRADLPLLGGVLHPAASSWSLVHTVSGTSGDPGAGTFSLSAHLPTTPGLLGVSFFAQALYLDPAAPRGVSFTNGLRITLY